MKLLKDSYIKNVGILFSGNIIAQLIPLFLAPIITRLFTPEELGIQGSFIALVALISIIANGRLELAIVLPKKVDKAVQLLKISLKISLIVAILCLLLTFIGDFIEAHYQTVYLKNFLPLVSLTVFTISTHNLFIQWLVRNKKFKTISINKILLSLTTNSLFILFGWLNYGEEGLIYGYIIGFLIATLIVFIISNKSINWKLNSKISNKELIKEFKDFPLINSLHAFSDLLFSEFIIIIIITSQFGIAATGIYIIMIKYLKAPTRFIGNAIGQVFYSETSLAMKNNKSPLPYFKKSIIISGIAAFIITLIIFLLGSKLFEWYLGEEWKEVGIYAKFMIIPIALGLLTSPISSIPLIFNEQKKSFIINIVGMLISAIVFYLASIYSSTITTALLTFSIPQSFLYLYLISWYYKLVKDQV